MTKNKIFVFAALILVGLGSLLISQSLQIGKFRFIACDVGQGDGMLLITPGGSQILIDGGPGSRILDCLSENMPFWDRKIEVALNTHAQQDHLAGIIEAAERYEIGTLITTNIGSSAKFYQRWQKEIADKKIKVYVAKKGDRITLPGVSLEVLWPPADKLAQWQKQPPKDLNVTAFVLRLDVGSKCAYLTSDEPFGVLEAVLDRPCDILKVAHHGSKTGTSEKLLEQIKPKIAIIQVGRNNSYGHPTPEVLAMLEKFGVKVLRNDLNGEIEVDVPPAGGGKTWSVRSER